MVPERDRDPSEVILGVRTRQDYIDEVASDHWSTEELAELLIEFDRRRERIKTLLSEASPKWLPIETAPRDGTVILGLYNYRDRYGVSANPDYGLVRWSKNWNKDGSGEWTDQFADEVWMEPTHWMPLPEAP